jgi:hypothetical protein
MPGQHTYIDTSSDALWSAGVDGKLYHMGDDGVRGASNAGDANNWWFSPRNDRFVTSNRYYAYAINANRHLYRCQMPCIEDSWSYVPFYNMEYIDMEEKELWALQTGSAGLMHRHVVETKARKAIPGPCGGSYQKCATQWKTVSPHRNMVWASDQNGGVWQCQQPCGGNGEWKPVPFSTQEEAELFGEVTGFIGIAPGSFITHATDARHVRLIAGTPFGRGLKHDSKCQNIAYDATVASSKAESHWMFGSCEGKYIRVVKLTVTVIDGLAYLKVNGAHWSYLFESDVFNVLVAHASWSFKRGSISNAFSPTSSYYGVSNVTWAYDASDVSTVAEADVESNGTLPGSILQSYGTPIAFVTNVRRILLVSGTPVGAYYKNIRQCGNIVRDPTMQASTANLAYWLFVLCDKKYVRFVRLRIELKDGVAYVQWMRAFYNYHSRGSYESIDDMDIHDM